MDILLESLTEECGSCFRIVIGQIEGLFSTKFWIVRGA